MSLMLSGAAAWRRISAGGDDPNWSRVSALLRMDGTDGSTVFPDETGKTWSPVGNVKVKTDRARFGQSAYFDAVGDWIASESHADFTLGTGDFTVECWANFVNHSINRSLVSFGGGWILYLASNGIFYLFNGSGANVAELGWVGRPTPLLNAWHHVAAMRSNGHYYIAVDGMAGSTPALSSAVTTGSTALIGAQNTSGASPMYGWIDEVRITKGVARYPPSFTPPSAPFPSS